MIYCLTTTIAIFFTLDAYVGWKIEEQANNINEPCLQNNTENELSSTLHKK